jgi:hypothetical protein
LVAVSTLPPNSPITHNFVGVHDTLVSSLPPGGLTTCHAVEPPVGFVAVITLPKKSPVTHSVVNGHEISSRPWEVFAFARVHPPVAAWAELITFPRSSVATHVVDAGAHETPCRLSVVASACVTVHAAVVGLVVVTTLPPSSIATQSVTDAHETFRRKLEVSTGTDAHAPPAAGFVDLYTRWSSATAMHNVVDGQETPATLVFGPAMLVGFHAYASPVGCVVVTTWPRSPTATHSVADGHDASRRSGELANGFWLSTRPGDDHDSGPAAPADGAAIKVTTMSALVTARRTVASVTTPTAC